MSQSAVTAAQRRGKFATSFRFGAKALEHAFGKGSEFGGRTSTAWTALASPAGHIRVVGPDDALRWVVMVTAMLAVFSAFRATPQPMGMMVHAGVAVLLIAGCLATARRRRPRFTRIPAGAEDVVVIDDAEAPAILGRIEEFRRKAAHAASAEEAHDTVRQRLRRLRDLMEAGALTEAAYAAERKALLGGSTAVVPHAPAEQRFTQRAIGETVTVELGARGVTLGIKDWFEGESVVPADYRTLGAPMERFDSRYVFPLTIAVLLWAGAGAFAMMAMANAGKPANHYIGGPGLTNALSDYWPAFLLLIMGVALAERITRVSYATPYPGLRLLRDRRYAEIAAAIEARRVASLRALAVADPARWPAEQAEIVEWLAEEGLIDDAEKKAALEEAERVCGDPALDLPAGEAARPAAAPHTVH